MTTIDQVEHAAVEKAAADRDTMQAMSATYSPEDNKLRLRSESRLEKALYLRVKEAGFKWAPVQGFFVAPMWTPARRDLLLELCGEITDEDTSLIERAEERSERFEVYSDRRSDDADAARNAVSSIADQIPFGQPIIVGHHSERRARKDADRIENGMRKAVSMWERSEYWTRRAAGAVRHAKYKELPAVRHRRIKGLEADKRKQEKIIEEAQHFLKLWNREVLTVEIASTIANHNHINYQEEGKQFSSSIWSMLTDGKMTAEKAREEAIKANNRRIDWASEWLSHYNNRIAYERAMLNDQGGVAADKFDVEVGGRVLIGNEWLVVMRVNKSNGVINSVTTTAKYVRVRGIEEVKDYKAPEAADVEKVKQVNKLPPLCNYPGEGILEMTKAEFDRRAKDCRFTRVVKATETHGAHRARHAFRPNAGYTVVQVFITDAKRVDPPAAQTTAAEPITFEQQREIPEELPQVREKSKENDFNLMRETLKQGVQVVSAPQLFASPPPLADRMVEKADIQPGDAVHEPSAGTGNIIRAIAAAVDLSEITLTATEINATLVQHLERLFPTVQTTRADFMQCEPVARYDRILMNPPFVDALDIEHITHAIKMLKPGGRLVAICANGPRQQAKLYPLIEQYGGEWEALPPDTFKESGTMVRAALITLDV